MQGKSARRNDVGAFSFAFMALERSNATSNWRTVSYISPFSLRL